MIFSRILTGRLGGFDREGSWVLGAGSRGAGCGPERWAWRSAGELMGLRIGKVFALRSNGGAPVQGVLML